MGNEAKSGLKIIGIVTIPSLLLTAALLTQPLSPNKSVNEREIAIEDIQENNTNTETQIVATSRSSIDRRENHYISVSEIEISKDMDLSKRCGISKHDFKELTKNLKRDTTKFFYDNSDTIYDLCEKYELNEIFFCGLIVEEAGWNVATKRKDTCNYISIMSKGKLVRFETPQEGLEEAAKLLHNNYLSEDGKFYNGKTLEDVQKKFAPKSPKWITKVYKCMNQII